MLALAPTPGPQPSLRPGVPSGPGHFWGRDLGSGQAPHQVGRQCGHEAGMHSLFSATGEAPTVQEEHELGEHGARLDPARAVSGSKMQGLLL